MAVTGDQERDHAFSLQSALWPLAAFVGSLIGGALPVFWSRVLALSLDHPAPYRYTLLVAVALLAPCVVPLWLARDARPARAGNRDAQGSDAATRPRAPRPTREPCVHPPLLARPDHRGRRAAHRRRERGAQLLQRLPGRGARAAPGADRRVDGGRPADRRARSPGLAPGVGALGPPPHRRLGRVLSPGSFCCPWR